jgi:hypothetical protein
MTCREQTAVSPKMSDESALRFAQPGVRRFSRSASSASARLSVIEPSTRCRGKAFPLLSLVRLQRSHIHDVGKKAERVAALNARHILKKH